MINFSHLESLLSRPLTLDELDYAYNESQAGPFRMETLGAVFSWRFYPNFPVALIAENLAETWEAGKWLQDEILHDTGYRKSHIESLDAVGVKDPVVIMLDSRGFDIGDGWHRIAWAYINNVDAIPAFLGTSAEDLTADWF